MALFGFGNVLLKVRRKKLPRPERASPLAILEAIHPCGYSRYCWQCHYESLLPGGLFRVFYSNAFISQYYAQSNPFIMGTFGVN